METIKKLPEKLSDLIDLALDDLEKVERDPRYVLKMTVWHSSLDYDMESRCAVCLAGSVIAKTLEVPPNKSVLPIDFDEHTKVRLEALDNLRCGYLREAARSVNLPDLGSIPQWQPNVLGITGLKESIRNLAQYFRSLGA
jgi:hypothetical protein